MDLSSLLLPLAVALLLVIATSAFVCTHGARSGSLIAVIKNRHRFLEWTTELVAASTTHTATTFIGVITANPSNIEHVLKTRFDNYPKGDRFIAVLEDFLGHGIFNSDGDHWKQQRKTASIEFSTKSLRSFVMHVVGGELVGRLLPLLARACSSGETLDLQGALERLNFDNICRVAFNEDPAEDSDEGREFVRAFEAATNLSVERFQHPFQLSWKLKRLLGIGSEGRLKKEITIVRRFAARVVRSRTADPGDDLLSRFLAEGKYSNEFLEDIIISFVLAGRDTTSAALSWFFWLVAARPAVRRRVREEVRRVRVKSGSPTGAVLTLDEVREMEYLHAALSESMRLYPAVPLETRCCVEDDVLPDGTAVGRGTTVMYNSYAMGRMESIWGPDWGKYRPERWLEGGTFRPMSPFKYPVFHAGPRTCLGKEMAYIQMKAVAASVLERFDIVVVESEKKREHELKMMLRVKGGLPVKVREMQVNGET